MFPAESVLYGVFRTMPANQLVRALVLAPAADGAVLVACEATGADALDCDVLQTADGAVLALAPDDEVLVWLPGDGRLRGVILGRVGGRPAPAQPDETPDELVIEARHQLTFKCGEGSITLREDGKILIKGQDLVSHAQGTNRIKGGSVAIN